MAKPPSKPALAKLTTKESDKPKDRIAEVLRNYAVIVLEDLKIKNMTWMLENRGTSFANDSSTRRPVPRTQRRSFSSIVCTTMRCSRCVPTG
jgi:hypothetical protein